MAHKTGGRQSHYNPGKFTDERTVWTRTDAGEAILYEEEETDGLLNVKMSFARYGRSFSIKLTSLTELELDSLQEFIRIAFERARPVVQTRDKVAQDGFAKGDDSFTRLYREVPKLVIRERKKREHNQGIRGGSEGVPTVERTDSDSTAGTGVESDDLAESVSPDSGTFNDDEKAD